MKDDHKTKKQLIDELTELRSKNAALEKSESSEKYRSLVENIRDVIYELDSQGLVLYISPAIRDMLGYDSAEIIGKNFIDLAYKDDQSSLAEWFSELRKGIESPSEYRISNKSNELRWARTKTRPILEDGRFKGAHGILIDVTPQKRAEKALKESEEKYRELVKYAPVGIYEVDYETGRFTSVNDVMCEYSGYTKDELLNTNLYNLMTEESQKLMDERLWKLFAGEKMLQPVEYCIRTKGGEKLWTLLNARYIYEEGKLKGATGIIYNITERKLAEEEMHRMNTFLDSIVENIPNMLFLKDARDLRFVRFNRAGEDLLGYSREDLLGKSDYDFFPKEQADSFTEKDRDVLRGKVVVDIPEEPLQTRNKGERTLHTKKLPILGVNGEPEYLLGISEDTTERKQAEEEKRSLEERLNRAEKMESLGILAGGVAHDLNNVLGIMVGYAELLLMGTDKSSPIRSKLVNIMEGGQKAATIVGDLLTLARRGVSGREVVNLNKIIADWQQSPEFEKLSSYNSAVKIKTELEPGLPNISASSVHLNKTIFNLVFNASEAMKKGGCVTIKTINQYVDKPIHGYDKIQEGDYVVLSVSDTGEGINADDIKRIFEPFYTNKVMGRSGTGLGLAVVWGTVKDHNGYINVESEEGTGSAFTLYFPVTREELSAEHVAVSMSEYMGKGESILVVDDVKGQRDLAEEMLKKLNYIVTSASSGEEALAYMKGHKVDLLVLDMIMDPGMDGLDTYRRALEMYPQQKAIIVSGFSESDRVKAAQALGAGAYVRKPYVIEKLGLAVKKELDRST